MESGVCKNTVAGLLVLAILSLSALTVRPFPIKKSETQPVSFIHLDPLLEVRHAGELHLLALRPLFSTETDCSLALKEIDFLYPLFTYDQAGTHSKWQFLQVLRGTHILADETHTTKKFTLFPVIFFQKSTRPNEDYHAFWPIGGRIKNRFNRAEIEFFAWPFYVRTIKRMHDELQYNPAGSNIVTTTYMTTWNFLAPIFHVRDGRQLHGWQFWPIIGVETKHAYSYTNAYGELVKSPGYRTEFFLWPIFWHYQSDLGPGSNLLFNAILPLYANWQIGPETQHTYLWPIGPTLRYNQQGTLNKFEILWPLIEFSTVNGTRQRRILPIFAETVRSNSHYSWFMWPLHKKEVTETGSTILQKDQVLFFLYKQSIKSNTISHTTSISRHLWPVFSWNRSETNTWSLRIISPLEPILGFSKSIERNYAPFWSIFASSVSGSESTSQTVALLGLYRHNKVGSQQNWSWLFGLIQWARKENERQLKVLYLPVWRIKTSPHLMQNHTDLPGRNNCGNSSGTRYDIRKNPFANNVP